MTFDFFKPIIELVQNAVHGTCPKCKGIGDRDCICPFQAEINCEDVNCGCCDDCAHECAMDI